MAKEELTQITISQRILQAMIEIVAMHTGLSMEECRFLGEKFARLTMHEFGYSQIPEEGAPPPIAYAWTKRAIELLGKDLVARGYDSHLVAMLQEDLDTFYRGVRGIDGAE